MIPAVQFKHQMIIMLEGSTPGSDIVWSTYDQVLNTILLYYVYNHPEQNGPLLTNLASILCESGSLPTPIILQLNTMLGRKYRVAEIQARSEDGNRDGQTDDLYVTARFPLKVCFHAALALFSSHANRITH